MNKQLLVQGIPTRVCMRGSGSKTLVFIHGAGGNAKHWMAVTPPAGWQLAAVDLPGHGASGGEAINDIFTYGDWVAALIEELGGCDVLVGHSMGGAITMAVALTYPQRIRGIVLVGTGARLSVSQAIFDKCNDGIAAKVEELLGKLAYGPLPSWEQIKQWYEMFGEASCQAYYRDFSACHHFDVRRRLQEIKLPAQIICGLDDRLTPYKYSEYLAAHLPAARLDGIPDAGHMVMLEQPEQFNRILASFCKEF